MSEKRAMSRPRRTVLRLVEDGRLELTDDDRPVMRCGCPFSRNAHHAARAARLVDVDMVSRRFILTDKGREALRRAEASS